MILETNDVMKIIGDQCVKLLAWTDLVAEDQDESVKKGAKQMKDMINAYTALICHEIQKAENERVCSMLEGMEKYEFKTDEKVGDDERDQDSQVRHMRPCGEPPGLCGTQGLDAPDCVLQTR